MGTNKNKPIIELDKPGGKPVGYWVSAKDAGAFYNIHPVNICYNINGKTKQAKGHYFRFATTKEIANYEKLMISTEPKTVESTPVQDKSENIQLPVETIPEVVQAIDKHENALSPFARLLQESKKKFNENSN